MNKLFIIITLLLTQLYILSADSGWLEETSLRNSSGNIYSTEEHPHVSMTKEVLIFDSTASRCQVFFEFTNLSKEKVSAKAGFPVREHFDFTWEDGIMTYIESQAGDTNSVIELVVMSLTDILGENIIQSDQNNFGFAALVPDLTKLNFSGQYIYQDFPGKMITDITRNGKTIPIDGVLFESKVIHQEGNSYRMELNYHYLHTIFLKGKESATITLDYLTTSTTDTGGKYGPVSYEWDYILSTGATWKGPIGEFYFITNESFSTLETGLTFQKNIGNLSIYHVSNYEPDEDAGINISWTNGNSPFLLYDNFEELHEENLPVYPDQPFVKVLETSSSIKETTTLYDLNKGVAYTDAGFGPLSLFDGVVESAWCEGKKDYGIGEWVSFELSEPVEGISIYNGFARTHFEGEIDFVEENLAKKIQKYEDLYQQNSRVKVLNIIGLDSIYSKTINLKDNDSLQIFPSVTLAPGRYKIEIGDIYPGTKYKDTCLSEIIFKSASYKEYINQDPFLFNAWMTYITSER